MKTMAVLCLSLSLLRFSLHAFAGTRAARTTKGAEGGQQKALPQQTMPHTLTLHCGSFIAPLRCLHCATQRHRRRHALPPPSQATSGWVRASSSCASCACHTSKAGCHCLLSGPHPLFTQPQGQAEIYGPCYPRPHLPERTTPSLMFGFACRGFSFLNHNSLFSVWGVRGQAFFSCASLRRRKDRRTLEHLAICWACLLVKLTYPWDNTHLGQRLPADFHHLWAWKGGLGGGSS